MITRELYDEYMITGVPEERILTDDIDPVDLWENYVTEDDHAICGSGATSIGEINQLNSLLIKQAGFEICMPLWGKVVDIGSGYNSLLRILNYKVEYYPCDLIKRTPETIQINGKLPFEDNTIDCVVACNMFQHITNKQRLEYVQESHRILKDDGRLFIACSMNVGVFPNSSMPKYKNIPCAITGDYFMPMPTYENIAEWCKLFSTLSITQRNDGWTGIWLSKKLKPKEEKI